MKPEGRTLNHDVASTELKAWVDAEPDGGRVYSCDSSDFWCERCAA